MSNYEIYDAGMSDSYATEGAGPVDDLKQKWNNLPTWAKFAIPAVIVAVIIAIVYFTVLKPANDAAVNNAAANNVNKFTSYSNRYSGGKPARGMALTW